MRFLIKASWEVEAGNALAREGALGTTVRSILADLKPAAASGRFDQACFALQDIADVNYIDVT